MRAHLAVPAVLAALIPACTAPADRQTTMDDAAPAPTGIEGVWRIAETWGRDQDPDYHNASPQPSLYIFTNDYYSIVHINGDEPRPLQADTATRLTLDFDETRAIFVPYVSNSGTWMTSGDVLTTHPIVAVWPNFMAGDSAVFSVAWEGADLVLTRTEEDVHWKARLTRID